MTKHALKNSSLAAVLAQRIQEGNLVPRAEDSLELQVALRAYAIYAAKQVVGNLQRVEQLQEHLLRLSHQQNKTDFDSLHDPIPHAEGT
jgi:hypothetical protein